MLKASPMDLDQVKAAYRAAIDATAGEAEGQAWWSDVAVDVGAVIAAPDGASAAAVIAWWHADWRAMGDSPARAAQRLRRAAARMAQPRASQGAVHVAR